MPNSAGRVIALIMKYHSKQILVYGFIVSDPIPEPRGYRGCGFGPVMGLGRPLTGPLPVGPGHRPAISGYRTMRFFGGKRQVSRGLAVKLGKRFGVSPAVFLQDAT
ncbi:MAG: hypothetical protein ACK59Y_13760 [Betaproteobacteria bacterium]|nr:hypothetical protein [Betaproteobacteria bacterium]